MREFLIVTGPLDRSPQSCGNRTERPRLDVDEVAKACNGRIVALFPSSGGLRGPRLVSKARSLFANCILALRLVSRLSAEKTVYSTGETWGIPIGLAGRLARKRFVHVVYVHRVYSTAWRVFLRLAHRLLAIDGWICVTRYQESVLRRCLGSELPIAAISQGVDTLFWDVSKAKPNGGEPYILSVGTEMRNYPLLFEAVKDLDIRVIVKASSAWMEKTRLKMPLPPSNVEIITRRLSYIELRDLYAGAALVVVPLYDTVQAAGITTILEAMAMGKCVIATQSRGLPDALSGDNGIIVRTEGIPLREALLAALKTSSAHAELASAARTAAKATSIEAHSAGVAALAEEVTARAR
jgi:glycosyltransferase involved in cell wall biosynthesis